MDGKLLQRLRAQRDELDTAIRVIERLTGGATRAATMRNVATAIAASNGHTAPKYNRGPYKKTKRGIPRFPRNVARGTGREIKEIKIPPGVSFDGVDFPRAVALAVRAVKQPIPTPELTSLLTRAGVVIPNQGHPPARYVGMIAATLAHHKILKKTATGWTKGSRA